MLMGCCDLSSGIAGPRGAGRYTPHTKASDRRRNAPPPVRFEAQPTLDMDCVSVYRHRGLAHDLSEARVGVDGHPYLLRGALDQLGEDALGYKVRDLWAYHVHAEDEIGLRVGDHLHEAVGLALYEGLADGPEGEVRLLDLVALFLGLILRKPEGGDLRAAEGNAWDHVLVHRHRVLAGHVLDGDDALVAGGVSQPVASDPVSCRVDAVLAGPVELVYLDLTTVVHFDARDVQVEVLDHRLPTDGDQDLLGLQSLAFALAALFPGRVGLAAVGVFLVGLLLFLFLLLLANRGNPDLYAVVGLLQALRVGHGACHDPDATLFEPLLKLGGDVRVLGGQQPIQDLDDGHLGAEVAVHAREFGAHGPATQNDNRVRIAVRRNHVVAGDHFLTVYLQARQGPDGASGGYEDVLALDLLLAVLALHLYLLRLNEATEAREDLNLVLT